MYQDVAVGSERSTRVFWRLKDFLWKYSRTKKYIAFHVQEQIWDFSRKICRNLPNLMKAVLEKIIDTSACSVDAALFMLPSCLECRRFLLRLLVKHNASQLPCYLFSSLVKTLYLITPQYRGIRSKRLFCRPSNS